MKETIFSARLLEHEVQSNAVFHSALFSFVNFWILVALQLSLSRKIIICRGWKQMHSFFKAPRTSSGVSIMVETKIGHPSNYSTAMRKCLFLLNPASRAFEKASLKDSIKRMTIYYRFLILWTLFSSFQSVKVVVMFMKTQNQALRPILFKYGLMNEIKMAVDDLVLRFVQNLFISLMWDRPIWSKPLLSREISNLY